MTIEVRRLHEEPEIGWVNASGLPDSQVSGSVEKVGRQVAAWIDGVRAATQRSSLFDRTAYAAPDNPYVQMRVARKAVSDDDIVAGVADVIEGLAFQGCKWESPNAEDADVFNQMWRDLNGDDLIRTWQREEFTYSQVVVGVWWGQKEYTVRGYGPPPELPLEQVTDPATGMTSFREPLDPTTNRPMKPSKGQKRKKKYDITVPVGLTFLDPCKVVPLGSGIFGADRLAWQATKAEIASYRMVQDGTLFDPVMERFFDGHYVPTDPDEKQALAQMGVDHTKLLMLNPANVFRHTRTKPDYLRFPDLRLKSVFTLLDQKQQLMEADRVMLIGAANYLLLIKKGLKDEPAEQAEIDNLKEGMRVMAKLPVIVSDHRLEIEIIVPPQDHVLDEKKYNTIDKRILNRALGSLEIHESGARVNSSIASRGVARLLESRRLMMKRSIEWHIARATVEHPANARKFEGEPNLTFVPRNVQLDNDQQMVSSVMQARTQKEISRESFLEFLGFDQEVEAQRREYEEDSGLDAIFGTTVPFDSPANGGGPNGGPAGPIANGMDGGRPVGGGTSADSPQKKVAKKTAAGNPSTRKAT